MTWGWGKQLTVCPVTLIILEDLLQTALEKKYG